MRELKDLSLAFLQADLAWENPEANRAHFDEWLAGLRGRPDLVVLPETCTTGFPVDPRKWAEKPGGETFRWLRRKAREIGAVICASLLVKDAGRYYNRLVWMRPNGRFSTYDKRHVFHMGGEHRRITPGKMPLHVRWKGWNFRPLVCYDLRFPVWCKNAYTHGRFRYDLLLFVANWPAVRVGPWRQLLVARAIENQAYVLGVNRVGSDGNGMSYAGESCLVDPKGIVLASAGAGEEAVVETRLSGADLVAFRGKFNVGMDWDRFEIVTR